MRRHWRASIGRSLGLALVAGVLLAGVHTRSAPTMEATGYEPVAPATALQAALQAQLKYTRDWLEEKDFLSAADGAQGLTLLAQLYGYQCTEPRWRERTAVLRETCAKLAATARAKDADGCGKLLGACVTLLDELAQHPPAGARGDKHFQAFGGIKAWMWLMEGAYGEARWAKTARDVEPFAYTIAEEANSLLYLRSDPGWRRMALDVRDAALQAAAKAKQNDLAAARQAVKDIHTRCEACHGSARTPRR